MSLVADTIRRSLVPPETMSHRDWLIDRFYLHNGTAFDETRVPWVTAPQGPCWAYDNPQFNEIWLQWAARMSKTNFALSTLMRRADLDPCEMMFATPDEQNCKTVFKRWWMMFANCPTLRDQCPNERLQSKLQIDLKRATVYGAWPRGKSRLADKSIPAGVGNEIDKWDQQSTSTEGDPLPRFLKRGAEYPDRKFVLESTPGTKGKSRVEAGRLRSTNHSYHVPCPHCGKFQQIKFGDGISPGGIFWDKSENGESPIELAEKTAHYVCKHCQSRIDDIHRADMMNLGVWVPAGCKVDHDKAITARDLPPDDDSWLRGTPLMWGNKYGSQISVFYALFHGWGQIVVDFLHKKTKTQNLRQWTNEDKGETWEIVARRESWQDVAERLIVNIPRYIVPDWGAFIVVGVDRQVDHYVYVVDAWGPGQVSHTLDYGTVESLEQLDQNILQRSYFYEDGAGPIHPLMVLIDSGYRPVDVYAFCQTCQQQGRHIFPCKGSNVPLDVEAKPNKTGSNTKAPGTLLIYVDTFRTQDWMDQTLYDRDLGDQLSSSLFHGSAYQHEDFIHQLMNDAIVQKLDKSNNPREGWQRIDEGTPNDVRDCRRYSRAAMILSGTGDGVVYPRKKDGSL